MTTLDSTPDALAPAGGSTSIPADRLATNDVSTDDVSTFASTSFIERLLTSAEHKSLGTLLSFLALTAAVLVAVVGALLGLERIGTDDVLFPDDTIAQLFSVYRFGLVFAVLAPLALGVALIAVPLQVGAKGVAFGRLAAFGVWTWFVGLVLAIIAYATNGGIGGGNADMVDLFLASVVVICVGLTAVAVSVATTVLAVRAPGMTMRRVPLYAWSALVMALGAILLLPIVAAAAIMGFVDHRYSTLAFGTGGYVGTILDFALGQPATIVFAIPAAGLVAELLPVVFRRRQDGTIRQISMLGIGLMLLAAFGAVAHYEPSWRWLETAGMDRLADTVLIGLFIVLPLLGTLIVLANAAPMAKGSSPKVTAPFAFALIGLLMVMAGILATDIGAVVDFQLTGTVFIESSVLYVVYGAVLSSIGALMFWAPKFMGRQIGDKEGLGLAGLGGLAVAAAALPLVVAGFLDQPLDAPAFDQKGPLALLNLIAAAGQVLMLIVVLGAIGLFAKAMRSDADVADDPWEGQTLEWGTPSPAPYDNFVETQTVMSAQPMLDRRATPSNGGDAS